jgi:hypothetical protein
MVQSVEWNHQTVPVVRQAYDYLLGATKPPAGHLDALAYVMSNLAPQDVAGVFKAHARVAALQVWIILRTVPGKADGANDGFEFASGISARSGQTIEDVNTWATYFDRGSDEELASKRQSFLDLLSTAVMFGANRLVVWEAAHQIEKAAALGANMTLRRFAIPPAPAG